jgi:hypothetical protein
MRGRCAMKMQGMVGVGIDGGLQLVFQGVEARVCVCAYEDGVSGSVQMFHVSGLWSDADQGCRCSRVEECRCECPAWRNGHKRT